MKTVVDLSRAARDAGLRRFVPDQIQTERISICKTCPRWDEWYSRCLECGCQMRVKTVLRSSECPLKKWGRYTGPLHLGDAGIDAAEHEERPE
jgi:hypothetical protein